MINIPNRTTVLSHHNNSITIIDIGNDEVLSFIELGEDENYFFLKTIAFEEDYETSILEASLMFSYPKGVVYNRDVDLSLWGKIFNGDGIIINKLEYGTKIMMIPSEQYEKLFNLSVLLNHKEIYEQGRNYYTMKCDN